MQIFESFGRRWPANLNMFKSTAALNTSIEWPTWTRHIPFLPFKLNLLGDTFQTLDLPLFITSAIIPCVAMIALPIVMLFLLRRRYRGQFNRRDAMIALFTGFMVVWLETTFIGVSFRGQGMALLPPWKVSSPGEWINLLTLIR